MLIIRFKEEITISQGTGRPQSQTRADSNQNPTPTVLAFLLWA